MPSTSAERPSLPRDPLTRGLGPGGASAIRWSRIGPVLAILPALFLATKASGQPYQEQPDPGRPLGQPAVWTLRTGIDLSSGIGSDTPGFDLHASLRRDLVNPVTGLLGIRLEPQLLSRSGKTRLGARLLLDAPVFFVRVGGRWDPVDGFGPVVGLSLPPRRGGWPLPGSTLEFGWYREGGHRLSAGLSTPLGGDRSGRTRPRSPGVRLPAATASAPDAPAWVDGGREVLEGMHWIATLHNLYWFTDRTGIGAAERVLRSRQILEMLELEIGRREVERGGRPGYPGEVDHYHAALVSWFGRALEPGSPGALPADPRTADIARMARQSMLDHVILRYNATIGQLRVDDRLDGLVEAGEAAFAAELDGSFPDLDAVVRERVLAVFRRWGVGIDAVRAELAGWTRDSRVQWLPLALVLHPSEHDRRARVDAIIERALGRPFADGNQVEYFDAHRFPAELVRTIRETRRMHLLWIHDFRALRDDGKADMVGVEIATEGYLRALIEAVRRHDSGAPIPTYVIFLDQYYYEETQGRTWMTLLENPLAGGPRLPGRPERIEGRATELQAELRAAVAASVRLAEAEREHGPGWIEDLVKVQVNITNPSDFSFRSKALLAFPVGADNLMRDHRKIVARDLDHDDPWSGEVIVTGMGVGDHYADPGWDDRSLVVRGPGALPVLDEAQALLEAHGVRDSAIPEVLRPRNRTYGDRGPGSIEPPSRRDGTSGATLLQLHNRTGWTQKEASFVQMLLYDLLPPGTVIYVPDSLWTSPEWMAQLVSAALRGCEVLIVAPALSHAPQPGFPSMSETRELLTALLVVQQSLGRVLGSAGGRIRAGIYARSTSTTNGRGRVAELRAALATDSNDGVFIDLASPEPGAEPFPFEPRGPVDARGPLLHGKTQLYASRDLLDRLALSPELPAVLTAYEEGRVSEEDASRAVAAIATESGEPELYLLVGSMNRNVRSMALDGEVMVVVSGAGATVGLLDFVLLVGAVRWLQAPEDLDRLIPPFPEWKRLLGRWLLRII